MPKTSSIALLLWPLAARGEAPGGRSFNQWQWPLINTVRLAVKYGSARRNRCSRRPGRRQAPGDMGWKRQAATMSEAPSGKMVSARQWQCSVDAAGAWRLAVCDARQAV